MKIINIFQAQPPDVNYLGSEYKIGLKYLYFSKIFLEFEMVLRPTENLILYGQNNQITKSDLPYKSIYSELSFMSSNTLELAENAMNPKSLSLKTLISKKHLESFRKCSVFKVSTEFNF